MLPAKLAFVDIETTGTRSSFDRIIEIGILRVENNRLVKKYQTLINPQAHIPPEIEMLTGITPKDLERAPTFRQVADEILEILSDTFFVAHNVRFDYGFLKHEFRRRGISFSSKHFCTVKLSRCLFPSAKHHNLDSLIERFQIVCKRRHRAFDDAKVLFAFYKKIQKMFPLETLEKAINIGLSRPTIPLSLTLADLENLPELPGVYIFYADEGVPLYIGKSINIRERVLSHFSGDIHSSFEMKISQQIKSIETIPTAGELGALFLESSLIKERIPLYNRMLRNKKELIAIKAKKDKDGYMTVFLEPVSEVEISDLGFFKSDRQAKDFLYKMAREHGLCERLLGLEKTKTACFAYRLGRCKGACVAQEAPLFYNLRFSAAFSDMKIASWPFSGPIIIEETDATRDITEYLLVDKWCFLGKVVTDENGSLNDLTRNYSFDLDMYKILRQYLRSPKNMKRIKLLDGNKDFPLSI